MPDQHDGPFDAVQDIAHIGGIGGHSAHQDRRGHDAVTLVPELPDDGAPAGGVREGAMDRHMVGRGPVALFSGADVAAAEAEWAMPAVPRAAAPASIDTVTLRREIDEFLIGFLRGTALRRFACALTGAAVSRTAEFV